MDEGPFVEKPAFGQRGKRLKMEKPLRFDPGRVDVEWFLFMKETIRERIKGYG